MFTLKFISNYSTGDSTTSVVCCQHYSVYKHPKYTEITLYKDFTSVDGVTYVLAYDGYDRPHFHMCYIENINGKTIDKLEP